ncbi:winged helix-turn-helix domain-containing protein [Nonomuraea monospora]
MREGAQLLDVLAPMSPYWPDFLTPPEASNGLDSGLESFLSTPRDRLSDELARLALHRRLPGWVSSVAAGDAGMMIRVAAAMRAYHDAAIAPYHSLIGTAVAADRAQRARDLLEGGTEGLFDGMAPLMRWRYPALDVTFGHDCELHLLGRGLRLVPSYFCQRVPVTLADPGLPPVLIYPIGQKYRWERAVDGRSVEALLGRTRAAVLRNLSTSATTSELARTLEISPASASRHATVLRDAGLIVTARDGPAVLHTITPLGKALLDGRILDRTT